MMRQQRQDIVVKIKPEEKFREFVLDGTMERIVDARLNNEELTLRNVLHPERIKEPAYLTSPKEQQ